MMFGVPIHHPLGLKQHPLEDAGILISAGEYMVNMISYMEAGWCRLMVMVFFFPPGIPLRQKIHQNLNGNLAKISNQKTHPLLGSPKSEIPENIFIPINVMLKNHPTFISRATGWWFQPISQNGNLPQLGVKIKHI